MNNERSASIEKCEYFLNCCCRGRESERLYRISVPIKADNNDVASINGFPESNELCGAVEYLTVCLMDRLMVAIKIIDTRQFTQEYVVKNLTREAKIISMLNHRSIVRLYETIQCGPVYYLVTELATGGDLYTHVRNQASGRLDETSARSYARQLVAALRHMHSRDIVHRDLKMENVMLHDEKKELVKIVDFGLSNIHNSRSPLKTQCGSPEYAAPELFVKGKKYGPEVDLWSLGVIVYVMGAGRLPFISPRDGVTTAEERRSRLMGQINRGLAAPQERAISTLSAEYKHVVARLLTPAAHKRIAMVELCLHPWIAFSRRKLEGQNELPAVPHQTIVEEIVDFTGMNRQAIDAEIHTNQFGIIGGMYNIIAHDFECCYVNNNFQSQTNETTSKLKRHSNKPTTSMMNNRNKMNEALSKVKMNHDNEISRLPFTIAEYDRNSKGTKQASLGIKQWSMKTTVPTDCKNTSAVTEISKKQLSTPNTPTLYSKLQTGFRPLSEQIIRKENKPNSGLKDVKISQLEITISENGNIAKDLSQKVLTRHSCMPNRRSTMRLQCVDQGDNHRTLAASSTVSNILRLGKGTLGESKLRIEAANASKIPKSRNKTAELTSARAKRTRENNEATGSRFTLRRPRSILKTFDKFKWKNSTVQLTGLRNEIKKR